MTDLRLPAPPTFLLLARLLGESERTVRWLVALCGLLAAVATAAWVGTWVDTTWLPNTNEGSARVLHGFIALSALLWGAVTAGLLTAGRWVAPGAAWMSRVRAAAGTGAGLLR
jgi:hypothetical protein